MGSEMCIRDSISAGEIVSFQTFMTGELFGLLSQQSVLRHSVESEDWDNTAFAEAVNDALSKPEILAARLFRVRATQLLNGSENGTARAQLSGLLIGTELAAARPYWLGQQVAVIGAPGLAHTYVNALVELGVPATRAPVEAMTLSGLCAVHRALEIA